MCIVSILIGFDKLEFPIAGRPEKGDVMLLSYILEDNMGEECYGYREYGFEDGFPEDILIRFDSIMITPDDSADYSIFDWTLVDWRDIPVDKVNAPLRDFEPHNLLVTAEINLYAKNESDLNKEVAYVKDLINKAVMENHLVARVKTEVIENKNYKKYEVICLQGTNFMADTKDNPLTEREIRDRFWSLEDCRTKTFEQFTLDYIAEMWHVQLKKVRG